MFAPFTGIYSTGVCDFSFTYSLPLHTEVAGFGVHVPFGDIPSDVHTAVIFPVGTNPVLHLKSISAPPSVLGTATMEPLSGARGIPQVTGRRCNDNSKFFLVWCCTFPSF